MDRPWPRPAPRRSTERTGPAPRASCRRRNAIGAFARRFADRARRSRWPSGRVNAREYALSFPPPQFKVALDFPELCLKVMIRRPYLRLPREPQQRTDSSGLLLREISGIGLTGEMVLSLLDNLRWSTDLAGFRKISNYKADRFSQILTSVLILVPWSIRLLFNHRSRNRNCA